MRPEFWEGNTRSCEKGPGRNTVVSAVVLITVEICKTSTGFEMISRSLCPLRYEDHLVTDSSRGGHQPETHREAPRRPRLGERDALPDPNRKQLVAFSLLF